MIVFFDSKTIKLLLQSENFINCLCFSTKMDVILDYVLDLERSFLSNKSHSTQHSECLKAYIQDKHKKLSKTRLDPKYFNQVLLLNEILIRLKIKDQHIIYDLINQGKLKKLSVRSHAVKTIISLESLINYLGKYATKKLHTTEYASKILNLSIHNITRTAKNYDLGFKLKPTSRSAIRLSEDDIEKLNILFTKKYNKIMPTIYAFYKTGSTTDYLMNLFNINQNELINLIEVYSKKRQKIIQQNNSDNKLTVLEISKALNTTPQNALKFVYSHNLKIELTSGTKKIYLVDLQKFMIAIPNQYLGTQLYSSVEASKLIDKSVKDIDIIAYYKKIGLKLTQSRQGKYRFSEQDLKKLENYNVFFNRLEIGIYNKTTNKTEFFKTNKK